ncbi:MAG: hypothetical protein LBM95_03775 [Lactobacillales bacterium]|jgi:hypothetical protein|nr:hypothetical protein [Lactobacillales bacterium]
MFIIFTIFEDTVTYCLVCKTLEPIKTGEFQRSSDNEQLHEQMGRIIEEFRPYDVRACICVASFPTVDEVYFWKKHYMLMKSYSISETLHAAKQWEIQSNHSYPEKCYSSIGALYLLLTMIHEEMFETRVTAY